MTKHLIQNFTNAIYFSGSLILFDLLAHQGDAPVEEKQPEQPAAVPTPPPVQEVSLYVEQPAAVPTTPLFRLQQISRIEQPTTSPHPKVTLLKS